MARWLSRAAVLASRFLGVGQFVERGHGGGGLAQKLRFGFDVVAHHHYVGPRGQGGVFFFAGVQPAAHDDGRVSSGPIGYAAFTFHKPSPDQELFTGPDTPGRVVVTRFDTLARVVSGTFEFTAVEVSGGLTGNGTPVPSGKTVRVTEGRFDCKF